jgi:S1-C subfamily serine protease
MLGISVRNLTAEEARRTGVTNGRGVYVARVESGSAADRSGIKAGDIILRFDGFPIRSAGQLAGLVADTPTGRAVDVGILRGMARRTLTATVNKPRA